jgi:hypothetical protein
MVVLHHKDILFIIIYMIYCIIRIMSLDNNIWITRHLITKIWIRKIWKK